MLFTLLHTTLLLSATANAAQPSGFCTICNALPNCHHCDVFSLTCTPCKAPPGPPPGPPKACTPAQDTICSTGGCQCNANDGWDGFKCNCPPAPPPGPPGPHGHHGPPGPGPHHPPRPQPPPFPIPSTDDNWVVVSDEVLGPLADVSLVKATSTNNSDAFTMVQFLAGLGDPFWGFKQLPSASLFSFSKTSQWERAQTTNHTGDAEDFDVRTIFASIIQFGDNDGDGKYNPKIDTTYKTCGLDDMNFGMGFSQSVFHPGGNENITGIKISAAGQLGRRNWPPGLGPPGPPGR